MALLRRLAILAALALSRSDAANATTGQCAFVSLASADAPVRAPLAAVVGAPLVDTVANFLSATPLGKVLAGREAHTCLAHLNGTLLGETLRDRLATPTCAPFANLTDVPFVKYALTPNASATTTDLLKYLKAVPNTEVDQFCAVYTASVVPCLATEILPALAVLSAKPNAAACCAAWSDQVLADFGYSVTGQITKMAQLFGDVMCAQQTPGAAASVESQRCGFTAMQTLLAKPDAGSLAATVLRNLQVPTSQMCLRAEGQPYVDTNNNSVTLSEPAPSGCVVTLDRITSWVYGLPSTQRSEQFDVKLLLEDGKCLPGSELYPTFQQLLPSLASSEVQVYFDKSCVHLPMQFGDKCSYARPALLVEWRNEPQPVAATTTTTTDGGEATATTATATTTPTPPAATPLASSATSAASKASLGWSLATAALAVVGMGVAL